MKSTTDLRRLKDKAADHVARKRFDKAADLYEEVAAAEPRDLQTRQRWADALRLAGRTPQAVTVYREIVDSYAKDGQLVKAIAISKVLLELAPDNTETQRRLAELYGKRGGGPAPKAAAAPNLPVQELPERADAAPPPPPPSSPSDAGEVDLVLEDPAVEETLSNIPDSPLFESLEPAAFLDLLKNCRRRVFTEGEVLIHQGDLAAEFFVLSSGEVKVVQTRPPDLETKHELARLHAGDFFGELALLSDTPRAASVVGATDGEALEFPAAVLQDLVLAHPAADVALQRFARARLLQNTMATSSLFRIFDKAQRKELITRFVIRRLTAGTAVVHQGQPSDGLYVVMQGRFRVEREGQRIGNLGIGELFGEMSLLTKSGATASVVAETGGKVLRLSPETFQELVATHPQLLQAVSAVADERTLVNEGVLGGKVVCDTEGLILM